ncbi:hypothetical protein BJ138DRAFT_978473, partial [Hygrophoropsis aurantiaca]
GAKALVVANNVAFRNCLVAMRPTATQADLPSSHDVTSHIHNSFIDHINELK